MRTKRNAREERAARKALVLARVAALVAQGFSRTAAAKRVRVGYATLWRWTKAFRKDGPIGLLPETDRCGRRPALEVLGVRGIDLDRVRVLAHAAGNVSAGWRAYGRGPECPPELKAFLRFTRTIPKSLQDAVCMEDRKAA